MREVNHEAVQPPFYYAVAGLWYDLGKRLGCEGGKLLYWTRFLNVPVYVLLIWLSYGLAKELLPASRFVYLGVPFVLIFLPQDIFYGLNNDVLSAPLATLSLYLLVRLYRTETPRWGLALCAGLATAAAVLTKFTNAPVLAILAAVAFLKLGLPWWRHRSLAHLVPVVLLLAASIIPIGCWMARNYLVLGDLTGFVLRSRFMTWTPKSIGEYWHHPIFTPGGLLVFWRGLATTLWRGEFLWHRAALASGPFDSFYFVSSTLLLLSFIVANFFGGQKTPAAMRSAAMFCLPAFVLSVALLILFSISYDFGTGPFNYPSRQSPYFAQGRLILGALVPLLIMYLSGLESLLDWLRLSFLRLPLLIIMVDLMALAEIAYSLDVFTSQYNWFHLL
jgi:4-amino-4-deoxy-L-arabinose transferase-like glycosyltransferase